MTYEIIMREKVFELKGNNFALSPPENGWLKLGRIEILEGKFPSHLYIYKETEELINVLHAEGMIREGQTIIWPYDEGILVPFPEKVLVKIDRGNLKAKMFYEENHLVESRGDE